MQLKGYMVLLITGLVVSALPFQSASGYSEPDKANRDLSFQVYTGYLIEDANPLVVEKIVSDYLSTLGFQLSSSLSKRWAEKGMVMSVWRGEDSYFDLSNLVNNECFTIRIYTSSEKESKDIEEQVISEISKDYPDYLIYDNVLCR